ncbi:trehalose-phosphatase [Moorella naiadis]|uniref:trehalose-phosphatase n=1 Tax=Moorella naiadis (nom. illeg.) TaxID=3093670 RepID=UPI003D9C99F7
MMSPGRLAAKIRHHGEILLMCDYDGTLVPLTSRPELARPGKNLLKLLQYLLQRQGLHLVIISGRSLADLRHLLPVPGLWLAGHHGTRVVDPKGEVIALSPPAPGDIPWTKIFSLARKIAAGIPGLLVENKGENLALHYRLAAPGDAAAALEGFRREVKPYLKYGLEFIAGHKVLELRPRGAHKGVAINYFTRRWPRALPLYLGDDSTDEDAFNALPANGLAVGIGPRFSGRTPYFLASPVEVSHFLFGLA